MSFYMHTFNRVAALSPLQMAQQLAVDVRDEVVLEGICTAMQASPTALAALRWAVINNIKVMIGTTEGAALGSYCTATRQIALREDYRTQEGEAAVETLVHEIRHAWQDARGLLPHNTAAHFKLGRVDYTLTQNALVEADAYAHGQLALAEIRYPDHCATADQRHQRLQSDFMAWFVTRAKFYLQSMHQAHDSAFDSQQAADVMPAPTGINPHDRADLVQLGRGFTGNGNYITAWHDGFAFLRKYAARSPFTGGNAQATRITCDIHKRQMQTRAGLRKGGV